MMSCWQEVTIVSDTGPALELLACGHAPALLFVHGSCCQASIWRPLMQAMHDLGISSAAVSLRGHGRSAGVEHLQEWRIENYVDDVIQAIQQLSVPLTLVGHSMGGLITRLAAARITPSGLVLVASSPVAGMLKDGWRMFFRHPATFLASSYQHSFLRLYRNPSVRRSLLFSRQRPESKLESLSLTLTEESWVAGNQMTKLLPTPSAVHCPVSVLGGADDFMVSVQSVRETARAYGVQPIFLPRCGHMMPIEIPPADLAALFQSILATQDSNRSTDSP